MTMTQTSTSQQYGFGSEGYYRHLCEHAGIALIGADPDLNVRTWNLAAARMFEVAADRMIGTPVMGIIPQEGRPAAEGMFRQAMETGRTFEFEFEHRPDQGGRRELAGTIAPVVSTTGVCLGVSLCIRDITRRIRLQNELSDHRRMASLGELAGAVAHHFNNILGGVITSIDFAGASGDPALTDRVLQQTSLALQRAVAILHGLQAFAEGDQQANDLADLTEIVNELADGVERAVADKGIAFSVKLPELPIIPVPKVPVLTVLRNITQNAIEAMPNGGALQVEAHLEDGWIVTRVTDTGRGLDESEISRIFEPFWSTKGHLASATGEGTGLGLAIAHGLAQMIGGAISVSSKPGSGCCFTFSIPEPELPENA